MLLKLCIWTHIVVSAQAHAWNLAGVGGVIHVATLVELEFHINTFIKVFFTCSSQLPLEPLPDTGNYVCRQHCVTGRK